MRLRDYFVGQPVLLNSLHSPRIVAERINAAAGSIFSPFKRGVVGGVWLGRIRLRFVSSFGEYNAKPVLAGRLREAPTGSILVLRYRAPIRVYLFHVVWYSILLLVALAFLAGEIKSTGFAPAFLVPATLLIFPLVLHYAGTRNSAEELDYLLDFLAEQADAK
jgi:hypothetical protein